MDVNELTEPQLARRKFLRQAGTAAWATPFILTMASSRASAQSCVPDGNTCGNYMVIVGIGAVCQPIQGAALCCGVCEVVPAENTCRCQPIS